MELILLVLVLAVLGAVAVGASRRNKQRELARRDDELAPVRKLAFEDITAFGEDLQELDLEMIGRELDAGARSDYQRALDAYESAKVAGDSINDAEDIRHVTEIVEDGRYAVACVRARVAGEPLPTRRPPCFFDPRHGPSVADVPYVPPDGVERDVPACALDVERVRAGAEPDTSGSHGSSASSATRSSRRAATSSGHGAVFRVPMSMWRKTSSMTKLSRWWVSSSR